VKVGDRAERSRSQVRNDRALSWASKQLPIARTVEPSLDRVLVQRAGNHCIHCLLSETATPTPVHGNRGLQAKLKVGASDDPMEREADRVAEEVVTSPLSDELTPHAELKAPSRSTGHTPPFLQRKCTACEDEEETSVQRSTAGSSPDGALQRRMMRVQMQRGTAHGPEALSAPLIVHDTLRSPGHTLDRLTRGSMESRFGRDFSHVRIHADTQASESARAVNARAFTVGSHVVFGERQYSPQTTNGRRLLAHELTHVVQQTSPTVTAAARPGLVPGANHTQESAGGPLLARQPADVDPVRHEHSAPPPLEPSAAKTSSDVIVDALEGYTTRFDSETILNQFRGKSAVMVLAIVATLKSRAPAYGYSANEMFDWLLGDLTEENRRELRQILARSGSTDAERIVVNELMALLRGYTSEDNSADVFGLLHGYSGSLDGVLVHLETAMGQRRDDMREQLFGDLDRVNSERLRQLFLARGGPIATGYAAARTARKIMNLLAGYTSHSDSSDIVWNFRTVPEALRSLVYVRLDELCRSGRHEPAEDVLMHDMDASDYKQLHGMAGLAIRSYEDTRTTAESIVSDLEWAAVVSEWALCGVIGIVTGLLSLVWDILKGVKDVPIAVWDLIWSLVYLLSWGAAGSSNWLRVKTFFTGLGNLLSNPGEAWDKFWEEQALEFHTIEGPLADCRRAEFVARKFTTALGNVALIFAAGYGVAKGAVSGVRAVATGAELAETFGVRSVAWIGARLARRRIGRFVAEKAGVASALLKVVREPMVILRSVSTRVRAVQIMAEDFGYWHYIRVQAGTAVRAGMEAATSQIARERRFWEDNRKYWRERGLEQQVRHEDLTQDFATVEQHLGANERPDPPSAVMDLVEDARQLDGESASLHSDVVGKATTAPTQPTLHTAMAGTAAQSAKSWDELTALAEAVTPRATAGGFRSNLARSGNRGVMVLEGPVGAQVAAAESMAGYGSTLAGEHATHGIGMQLGENLPEGLTSAPARFNLSEMKVVENSIRSTAIAASEVRARVETKTRLLIEYTLVAGEEVPLLVGIDREAWVVLPGSDRIFHFAKFKAHLDPATRAVTVTSDDVWRPEW